MNFSNEEFVLNKSHCYGDTFNTENQTKNKNTNGQPKSQSLNNYTDVSPNTRTDNMEMEIHPDDNIKKD